MSDLLWPMHWGRSFSDYFSFPLAIIIPPMLLIRASHGEQVMGLQQAAIVTFTPSNELNKKYCLS
jgi:hypothetical protein